MSTGKSKQISMIRFACGGSPDGAGSRAAGACVRVCVCVCVCIVVVVIVIVVVVVLGYMYLLNFVGVFADQ